MSNNNRNARYDHTTVINRYYLDETFRQLFNTDDNGESVVFQNLDDVVEKVLLYENITSNRLFIRKTAYNHQYRQYGCSCSRVCAFFANFGKRGSDGLVTIKTYNITHLSPINE